MVQVIPSPQISNIADLQKYNVNLQEFEQIRQSLYDSAIYPAAGATSLRFFQQPIGQDGKTLEDTNLQLAGQLPTNQLFLVEDVQLLFFPNFDGAVTNPDDQPAVFGAQAAAQQINDVYEFAQAGALRFEIGSKDYLREAPLQVFPAKTKFHVEGALADSSTGAADAQSRIGFAYTCGVPYLLNPPLLLIENQNFGVEILYPNGVRPLPSAADAKVFCKFGGILFRRAQ